MPLGKQEPAERLGILLFCPRAGIWTMHSVSEANSEKPGEAYEAGGEAQVSVGSARATGALSRSCAWAPVPGAPGSAAGHPRRRPGSSGGDTKGTRCSGERGWPRT